MTPRAFSDTFTLNFWSFLGFSFGKLIHSTVVEITPANLMATLLCYSELLCALIIFVILIFVILTVAREKYKKDIDDFISELGNTTNIFQQKFLSLYEVSLPDIEIILLRDNASLVNSLRKLRGMPELSSTEDSKKIDKRLTDSKENI
jgi:ABC-type antimicrobial peptide transport system permease subunit